jgi:protein-S-isoprenylcysteine O-methyltransferase Ste14
MSRATIIFMMVGTPVLAVLFAVLGAFTLPENILGWFLVLVGAAYSIGLLLVYLKRGNRLWEDEAGKKPAVEERGDRSLWLITVTMIAAFYLSPVEYVFFPLLPQAAWMQFIGFALVICGTAIFVWARRTLGRYYSGHVSVQLDHVLVQSGPYAVIRHPAYSGYLLMALGISLGYSSLLGLGSVFLLLLPSVIFRLQIEEKLLASEFAGDYQDYAKRTKRLIPGIW